MSKMLRKKLISAEFLVASSLLLAPGLALTGYGQNNTPQTTPPRQPHKAPHQAPHKAPHPLRLPPIPLPRRRLHRARRLTRLCRG